MRKDGDTMISNFSDYFLRKRNKVIRDTQLITCRSMDGYIRMNI